jgi:hypothetical protein
MKKTIQKPTNDILTFLSYVIIILFIIYFIYIMYRYYKTKNFSFELFSNFSKEYRSGMNTSKDVSSNLSQSSVEIENNFTNTVGCNEKDVQYCAKFGKNAINNFNLQSDGSGGCMCSDMESGV